MASSIDNAPEFNSWTRTTVPAGISSGAIEMENSRTPLDVNVFDCTIVVRPGYAWFKTDDEDDEDDEDEEEDEEEDDEVREINGSGHYNSHINSSCSLNGIDNAVTKSA